MLTLLRNEMKLLLNEMELCGRVFRSLFSQEVWKPSFRCRYKIDNKALFVCIIPILTDMEISFFIFQADPGWAFHHNKPYDGNDLRSVAPSAFKIQRRLQIAVTNILGATTVSSLMENAQLPCRGSSIRKLLILPSTTCWLTTNVSLTA